MGKGSGAMLSAPARRWERPAERERRGLRIPRVGRSPPCQRPPLDLFNCVITKERAYFPLAAPAAPPVVLFYSTSPSHCFFPTAVPVPTSFPRTLAAPAAASFF
eukprot:gene22307-biopygen4215